jgi:hypothetical protein
LSDSPRRCLAEDWLYCCKTLPPGGGLLSLLAAEASMQSAESPGGAAGGAGGAGEQLTPSPRGGGGDADADAASAAAKKRTWKKRFCRLYADTRAAGGAAGVSEERVFRLEMSKTSEPRDKVVSSFTAPRPARVSVDEHKDKGGRFFFSLAVHPSGGGGGGGGGGACGAIGLCAVSTGSRAAWVRALATPHM